MFREKKYQQMKKSQLQPKYKKPGAQRQVHHAPSANEVDTIDQDTLTASHHPSNAVSPKNFDM